VPEDHLHLWRPCADLPGKLGAENRHGVVGGDNDELAVLLLRVEERLAAEDSFEHVAGDLGPVEQHRPQCGQLIAAALPGQQVIAEMTAQPGERGAGRGLAEADPLPGAGHVALGQQRVQGDDEVHVKSREVHLPMISSKWMASISTIDFQNCPCWLIVVRNLEVSRGQSCRNAGCQQCADR
jgi:hypothetical protein